jgi:VanZ family protein
MLPHRFPRPVRLGLYALAVLILFVLCVLPQRELPDAGLSDKSEHAISWFILTATGYLLAPKRRFAIPAFAVAFGVLIEVVQASMGLGRHGDVRDFAVDCIGVAVAMACYFGARRFAPA